MGKDPLTIQGHPAAHGSAYGLMPFSAEGLQVHPRVLAERISQLRRQGCLLPT